MDHVGDRRRNNLSSNLRRFGPPVVGGIAIYGVLLRLAIGTKQWFWADDITFVAFRPVPHGVVAQLRDLLTPHSEHWNTLPLLAYRAVNGVVGWRAYWPYLALSLTMHVLLVALLWFRMRADDVTWWLAVPAALILAFHGPGGENILWAFQFGFLLSTAAGWVAIELACAPRRHHIGWIWFAALVSLMSSGLAPALIVGASLGALIRHGWRRAALVASAPAVVFIVWWRAYGNSGSIDGGQEPLSRRWATFVPFAWDGIVSSYQKTIGLQTAGVLVVALVLVGTVLVWRKLLEDHLASFCLAATALVMFVLIASGRAQLGDSGASRYAYLAVALTLPLVLALVSVVGRDDARRHGVFALVGVVLLVALSTSYTELDRRAEIEGSNEGLTNEQVAATFFLARLSAARPEAGPVKYAPGLSIQTARSMIVGGRAPKGPVSTVRIREGLAIVMTEFTVQPTYPLEDGVASIRAAAGIDVRGGRKGCIDLVNEGVGEGQAVVGTSLPASVRLTLDDVGLMRVVLGIGEESVEAVRYEGTGPVFWNLRDPTLGFVLVVPPGRTLEACGLDGQP